MRFALVIEPPEILGSVDRLAPLRLAVGRAGFNLVRLRSGVTLARELSRAIGAADPEDSALVYVAGEVRIEGGEILLDGDLPLEIVEMARIVASQSLAQLLFVIDARVQGESGDAMHAFEHVEAIVRAVSPRDRGIELLAAVESSPQGSPPSLSLTRFFVHAIEDASALAADGTMLMSRCYAKITEHPEFAQTVPSFAHVKGPSDFVVVAPIAERVSELPQPPQRSPEPPEASPSPPSIQNPRTPWRARAILPLPAIEPILADAERAHKKGEWDLALDAYRKALMLLGDKDPQAMASLYASVAEVKLAQRKDREAEANYEKALAADPHHARSLVALAKMALDAKDLRRAAGYERRLARALPDQARRVEAFARAAELYEEAKDLRTAVEVLEEAITVRPNEPALLAALRAGYEALRQWKKLVDLLGTMAEAAPLLHDKAQRRFEQADLILGRLRDEEVGLAVLSTVLEEDPTHERALAAMVAVHSRREEWRDLEKLYQRLVDAFAQREDATRAWDICKRLGQLRRDKLGDGPGALDAFTAAVKLRPKDVETRAALAELLVAKGDREAAVAELEIAARMDPSRAETHRRLYELHRRAGATDRAWLAATALEALGAVNVDQGVLVTQFRGELRATSTLDDAAWSLLRAPGYDPVIDAIAEAVAPGAVRVKLDELRMERKLVLLDQERRQPADSTATLVRTFAMASQVLGVKAPELYMLDSVPGGLAAVQADEPSTAFAASLGSGHKVPELSFLVARHLVYYRPEHYVLLFYPTLAELTALVIAAVKVARPELPLPISPASVKVRRELVKHVSESQKNALAVAVEQLDARGGKLDLAAWLVGVELTANRAGLLLAGDLAVALSMMRGEPRAIAELTFEDRRADLIAFTESRQLAELRVKLGIAARASLVPPPPSSHRLPPS
ncbi:MAG: tetratricopeptide repeat protein [Polyangiaceae bacterium]